MKIKYVLLVIWLLFYSMYLYGQDVNTTLLINPPYSPYLSDYLEFENQAVLTVQNNSGVTQQIYLKGSVQGDNGIDAFTEENYLPLQPISLEPFEVKIFLGGDPELSFFHLNNIETNLDQSQQNNIVRTGILPEGQYQICVEAFNFQTQEMISIPGTGCAFVQVTLALPPEIITPFEGDSLTQIPILSWTPPLGAIFGADWTYELIILALNEVQNPYDAMELAQDYNAGNPIIISDLKSNAYSYGPADVPLLDGPYAVRVRAVDENQLNLVENDGNSDIRLFYFGEEVWSPGEGEITPYSLALDSNGFDNVRVGGQLYYKFKEDEGLSSGMASQVTKSSAILSGGITNQGGNAPNVTSSEGRNSSPNFDKPSETKSLQNQGVSNQASISGIDQMIPLTPWGSDKYWKHDWTNTSQASPLGNLHVKLEVHTVMHNVTISSSSGESFGELDYLSMPGDYILNQAEVLVQGAGATLAETTTASDGSFTLEGLLHDSMGVIRHNFQFTHKGIDAGIWAEVQLFDPGINEVINPHDEYSSAVNDPGILTDLASGQNQGGNMAIVQNSILNSLAGGLNMNGFDPGQGGSQVMSGKYGPSVYNGATYHAETAYNALRIVVESPYYCSPDVEIFAFPGDQIDLPALTSYVQSYQLTTRVKADDSPNQAAAGESITDAIVEVVRPFTNGKTIHPDIPDNEGQQLNDQAKIDGHKLISKGVNANPDVSDSDMEVIFTRLVKYGKTSPYDLITYTDSLKGIYNYKHQQQTLLFPQSVSNEFNQTFEIEKVVANVVMEPANPRVVGLVKVAEGQETVYLDGVEVMLEVKVSGNTSTWKTFTDINGYFAFENITINSNAYEAQTPGVKIIVDHPGYKVETHPENGTHQLWKGTQIYKEFNLRPLGEVAGFVENEYGEPIMAFVRVENGPYVKTELIWSWISYLNTFSNNSILAGMELVKHFPVSFGSQTNSLESQAINTLAVNKDQDPNSGFISKVDFGMHQSTQKAAFKVKAQSGYNRRLIIEPLSTQYFRDTFLVDVDEKEDNPHQILGTFQVQERKHRIKVVTKDFGGNPIAGVSVHLDNRVKNTNSQGQVFFVFGTPETEFHVQVLPNGNFTKVDSFMVIHPSKDFTVLEFILSPASFMEGYVKSQVDSLPIKGARIAHVMHHGQYGEVTVETTTDSNGYYKLEGLPMSTQPIDFTATKYDPNVTYIGQTKSVAGLLVPDFLNENQKFIFPQTVFYLQQIDDLNLTGIWGFDLEVKSYTALSNGKASISGDLINIPGNVNFSPAYPELRISFKNLLIQPSDETDQNGISYAEPVAGFFKTQLVKFPLLLYSDFDATIQNFSEPSGRESLFASKIQFGPSTMNGVIAQNINSNPEVVGSQEILQLVHGSNQLQNINVPQNTSPSDNKMTAAGPTSYTGVDAAALDQYKDWFGHKDDKPTLVIKKDSSGTGYMEGYVLNELSSFNFTYYYTGKFYLGESPSDGIVQAIRADGQMAPSNYSLMVVKGTTPSNAFFDFEKFPAHIDKNYSYVTPDTFNLFTVLHTAIPQSTPSDLAINAGMIKVLKNDILPLAESDYKINFSLGNWKFESLGGWRYDKNVSGILIDSAVIKTKFLDVTMNDIILYPNKPIGDLDDINSITLAGVGTLDLTPGSKALLGYNAATENWDINIVNQTDDEPVASISGLPGFDSSDEILFKEIVMRSNDQSIISLKQETYSVYNILNFTANDFNSGEGYFQLIGDATLPIPGMNPVTTTLEFTGNPGSMELNVHAIKAILETTGQVQFRFDQWGPAQSIDWGEFRTYGTFRIYENTDTILLRGELTHINGQCKIDMIKINPGATYTSAGFDFQPGSQDQRISLNGGKNMIVRNGTQPVVGMKWDALEFYANMEGYQGANADQEPMKFSVHGGMEVTDSEVKLDGIETPFGDFVLSYNFQKQILIGQLTFQNMSFGAVNQMSGFMGFYIGAPGFMVNGAADGIYPVIGQLKVGFIVGAYQGLPAQAVSDVLEFCKMKKLPPHLAAGNIAGLFLTVNKPLWELHESIVILPELLEGSIDSEAGVDARIWMNFEGGFSFELGVLLYGNIKAMAQVAFCELCLGFAIEGGFAVSYNDYEGAGFKACLSAALSGSIDCGLVSGEFQLAKAVQFSATENGGTNVQVVDGDSCSGDMQTLCSLVAYDESQDPDAPNQN